MRRRIKKANVTLLSLVPAGANRLPTLYKSDGVEFRPLCKFDEERGEFLNVVYAPELRDSQGDIAEKAVVREMCHSLAKNGNRLDMKHDGKALSSDQAFVAESFIIQKGDARFAGWKDYDGNAVDVTDGWATLIKVLDADLKKSYREGRWSGVSLFAPQATVEFEKADVDLNELLGELSKAIKKHNVPDEEIDMKPEELKALLAENNAALLKSVDEKIAALNKSAPVVPPAAPPATLTQAPVTPPAAPAAPDLSKQISDAVQAALQPLLKTSTQPIADPKTEQPAGGNSTLTKEQQAGVAAGRRMAAFLNKTKVPA